MHRAPSLPWGTWAETPRKRRNTPFTLWSAWLSFRFCCAPALGLRGALPCRLPSLRPLDQPPALPYTMPYEGVGPVSGHSGADERRKRPKPRPRKSCPRPQNAASASIPSCTTVLVTCVHRCYVRQPFLCRTAARSNRRRCTEPLPYALAPYYPHSSHGTLVDRMVRWDSRLISSSVPAAGAPTQSPHGARPEGGGCSLSSMHTSYYTSHTSNGWVYVRHISTRRRLRKSHHEVRFLHYVAVDARYLHGCTVCVEC